MYDRSLRQAVEKRQINPDEPIEISPMDLVDDWISGIGTCRPRTSNTHRSALPWALAQNKTQGWEASKHLCRRRREPCKHGLQGWLNSGHAFKLKRHLNDVKRH